MSHDRDVGWTDLAADWRDLDQRPVEPTGALATRVRARGRLLAWWVATEVVFGVVATVVLAARTASATDVADAAIMATLTVACLLVTAFTVFNWQGAWRRSEATQREYLALALSRCHRMRRALAVGWALLGLEVAVLAPWVAIVLGSRGAHRLAYVQAYVWLAVLAGAGLVFLIALGRWIRREEAAIRTFEHAADA